jgi:hypothetical protein
MLSAATFFFAKKKKRFGECGLIGQKARTLEKMGVGQG